MNQGIQFLVGGAEARHHEPIVRRFVELSGGPGSSFAVIGAASGEPEAGFRRMTGWLAEAGVPAHRVACLPGTGDAEARALEGVGGVWFLGGDQNQAVRLLQGESGLGSPLLTALRDRGRLSPADGGLVLGGTSAGAALMSDPMVAAGTSFGALALPRGQEVTDREMDRSLVVAPGLGFFPEGLVDQHFDARARLGRLLEAALVEDGARRMAFGIDEATALVREGALGRLSVVGAGSVCLVDPRPARRDWVATAAGPRLRIRGAVLHALTQGDAYYPAQARMDFGNKARLDASDPGFSFPRPEASGVLSAYGSLTGFAARMLLDNDPKGLFADPATGQRYVRSLLLEDGLGWEIRLGLQEGISRLWYAGTYSFEGVTLDLLPVDVRIEPCSAEMA